jgi:hypothetical protein
MLDSHTLTCQFFVKRFLLFGEFLGWFTVWRLAVGMKVFDALIPFVRFEF